MKVTYEFAASAAGAPAVKLFWYQGDSKAAALDAGLRAIARSSSSATRGCSRRRQAAPEESFKDFRTPETTSAFTRPLHRVDELRQGPRAAPGSNFLVPPAG